MAEAASHSRANLTTRAAILVGVLGIFVLSASRDLDNLGHWLVQQDHVMEGIYCYELMTSLSSVLGMSDFRLLSALDSLADAYARMDRYDDAIRTEGKVKGLVARLEGTHSTNYSLANAHVAQFLDEKKQYEAARELLKKTIAELDEEKQPAPVVKAYAMSNLMDVYLHEKNYAEAEKVGLQLAPLNEAALKNTAYDRDPSMRLVEIYVKTRRLPEAEAVARNALAASESSTAPLDKADAHDLMARVYLAEGRTDDAAREFDNAMIYIKQKWGANHDRTLYWRARFDTFLKEKNPFPESVN